MKDLANFQKIVWNYYDAHGRNLPWRKPGLTGYEILVSEIMLQQTQVSRVVTKYEEFLELFPTINDLASATLGEVIIAWSGLGYNRRAKYLHQAAINLCQLAEPWEMDDLLACKGIGKNTAAAIGVYAYNSPHVFIETNIRSVYIYHFFPEHQLVSDADILELVKITLPQQRTVREWYWSLMDYGTYIKSTAGNTVRQSKHYVPQSVFEGSKRQLRGRILLLLQRSQITEAELALQFNDERLPIVLEELCREGLLIKKEQSYCLP